MKVEMPTEQEPIKIICGDCLEVMKEIPDNSVDLVLTDPPYNTGMDSKITSSENHPTVRFNSNKLAKKPWLFGFFNDNLSQEQYENLVKSSCKEFFRILKENRGIYIYISWRMLGLWVNSLENAGFKVKNTIVWDKIIHGLNYQNYAHTHELIIFGCKGNFFPNNKRIEDKEKQYYKDVWNIRRKIDNDSEEGHHETEKLIKIVKLPIIHATNKGDLILDCFLGSGTTAVACKQLGRKCIGIEINPEYCKIAKQRLSQQILNF